MAPAHRLYFAFLAEPATPGVRLPRAPAHITLVPPVTATLADAGDALRDAVAGRSPFGVRTTGRARFGPRRDVPVRLVAPAEGLKDLHEALIAALAERSVHLVRDRHVHDRFVPHIRMRPRDPTFPRIGPDRALDVDHVALLRSGDGATTVIEVEPLRG